MRRTAVSECGIDTWLCCGSQECEKAVKIQAFAEAIQTEDSKPVSETVDVNSISKAPTAATTLPSPTALPCRKEWPSDLGDAVSVAQAWRPRMTAPTCPRAGR